MLVRYEEIKDTDEILVISEIGKFLGQCYMIDFVESLIEDREPIEEEDFILFFVDKDKLNFCFQSFSAEKQIKYYEDEQ